MAFGDKKGRARKCRGRREGWKGHTGQRLQQSSQSEPVVEKMRPGSGQSHFQGSATEPFAQQLAQIVTSGSKDVALLQIDLAA